MTAAEKAIWDAALRGAYGAEDLNRVGDALIWLQAQLLAAGTTVTFATAPRTDWTQAGQPALADIAAYLANIITMRGALAVYAATPATPEQIAAIGDANDIEQILADVAELLDNALHNINLGWALGLSDIGLYGGIA